MSKCSTCENAIFDALWGAYKCSVRQHSILFPDLYEDCEHHKNGTPKESKANADYEANLQDCKE